MDDLLKNITEITYKLLDNSNNDLRYIRTIFPSVKNEMNALEKKVSESFDEIISSVYLSTKTKIFFEGI